MRGAIPPLPNTPSWRGAELSHRDFTFTFTAPPTLSVITFLKGPLPQFKGRHERQFNYKRKEVTFM
jgi:hypothetical protein